MNVALLLMLASVPSEEFRVTAAPPAFVVRPAVSVKAAEPDWKLYLDGAKRYRRTEYTQRIAVTDNRETNTPYHFAKDDAWANAPTSPNPNARKPYGAPGGTDDLDCYSDLYVRLPEGKSITVWTERVQIKDGGLLPKRRWAFPLGTRFVDVLSTARGVFEVRTREKARDGWASAVIHRDRDKAPGGYQGAGKACSECHSKAGGSEQYGITVRGDDEVFSFPVLREGTVEFDETLPLERVRQAATSTAPQALRPQVFTFSRDNCPT